jgi:hypothetical protein
MAGLRIVAVGLGAVMLACKAQAWTVELPPCTAPFQPFVYAGCYSDAASKGALSMRTTLSTGNMTVEQCVAECKGNGYRYAGLEYYGECFCGASVANGAQLLDDSHCSFPCNGNKSETCGGDKTLSVWQDTTFPVVADNNSIADYAPVGCWTDNSSQGRALAYPQDSINGANMTQELCLTTCKTGGFPFAGLEYGRKL